MKNFIVGEDVWIDATEYHFDGFLYHVASPVRGKVIHIDAFYPAKMMVSLHCDGKTEFFIVDANFVFKKKNELLANRAKRKNIKACDLVAIIEDNCPSDNEMRIGVVVKTTRTHIHVQTEKGLTKRRPERCIVITRQEKENG